jgi:hypothetical protein
MPEGTDQPQSSSTALVEVGAHPLEAAEAHYSKKEREAIAQFLNVSAEDTALVPFLAIAAQLDLSPIHGEIWLIKGRRKEGDQWVDCYRPAVGRDGLLKHARRQKDRFLGVRFGVVCANDTFEVEDDGWEAKVLHRMASLQPGQEKGHESRWRGPVLGAWAKLFFRDGSPPLYYYAPAHEHVKTEDKVKDGQPSKQFAGAWSYISTMIVKSAVSYVLRIGFGVTGVVPFDELRVDDPQMVGGAAGEAESFMSSAEPGDLDDDPMEGIEKIIMGLEGIGEKLAGELWEALRAINELSPFSWTPAKVRMRLGSDCDNEKARAVLSEIETEYKALRDKQAEREAREAESVEEAVQVVLARDVKPPVELMTEVAIGESDWVLVEDAIFDNDAGTMIFKLAGDREVTHSPTENLEVRSLQDASPDEG